MGRLSIYYKVIFVLARLKNLYAGFYFSFFQFKSELFWYLCVVDCKESAPESAGSTGSNSIIEDNVKFAY